ncbi:surface carbohydrate biosynthesis protein [Pleomorphomonas koreensis]|uniref:surface carbohydrate biosynthesis protein n=1 Tax=Pleomorphomonas koreensis TaxID=257440 RepID=UPI0004152F7C|nr:surface carbohydrate biosynthesis protein [Pleomorphomonas koreensis]
MAKVVILVDNKRRDLMVAAHLAHLLERKGIEVFLEPLEATFAVLAAHKPDMIIFNHLAASHLASYSNRLRKLGVLVAILSNEGLIYLDDFREFVALKAHSDAHVDLYMCWNNAMAESVRSVRHTPELRVEVIGIPRFDLYFNPYKAHFTRGAKNKTTSSNILICTNYVFAKYKDLPREEADRLFADWARNLPSVADYTGLIDHLHENRKKLTLYISEIAKNPAYQIILRPHPNEDASYYEKEVQGLPEDIRSRIRIARNENITDLILNCDVEISMDGCTTALESWIAGKPTIELPMEPHPLVTHGLLQPLLVQCRNPADLPGMVAEALGKPVPSEIAAKRAAHLERWCASPNGTAGEKAAEAIARRISEHAHGDYSERLTFKDRRKGWKLKLLTLLDKPYGWKPLAFLKKYLSPASYPATLQIVGKTMSPSDARVALKVVHDIFQEYDEKLADGAARSDGQ